MSEGAHQLKLFATRRQRQRKTIQPPPTVATPSKIDLEQLAAPVAMTESMRADFYDDSVTRAVLLLNCRERETDDLDLKNKFIHAQDWLCNELDPDEAWILREL